MWHIMKKGLQNEIVEMIKLAPGMAKMSEQTHYAIAYDLAEFKEYDHDQTIVHQDLKSVYNLKYLYSERDAIDNLREKDHNYFLSQKLTQRCNYPTLKQAWDEREVRNKWFDYLRQKKKAEELEKATGSVKRAKKSNQGKNNN